ARARAPSRARLQQLMERRERVLDALALGVGESSEALGEPRRTASPHAAERRAAFLRELEPHAPTVGARADAPEEPRRLETVDMPGHRGRGDALRLGELAEGNAGARVHQGKKRRL